MKKNIAGMIFHPPNLETIDSAIRSLYPMANTVYSRISPFRKKDMLRKIAPFRLFYLRNIQFAQNTGIDLVGYMLPMLPEQMLISSENAKKKINEIIHKATNFGVDVITLGAFTSIVTNQGLDALTSNRINITSGNTCTAALCIQSVLKLVRVLEIELTKCNVAIIGATGDIGSICAKVLVRKSKNVFLCSRNISDSQDWIKLLKTELGEKIVVTQDINKSIKNADIIICATSSISPLFDINEFLPGTIVCDLSMPPNVGKNLKELRRDILIYEGGRAQIPNYKDIQSNVWSHLFPKNSIYGCFIESIILSLGNKLENFSIGKGNITEEKIDEIYNLGLKYDIDIADYGFENYIYTEKDLKEFKFKRKSYVGS
ncbi:MAG: hypothetical protein AB7S78_03840 [Candidatus Omnitrophota bacterium]